jgi:hypothetical protein
MGGACRSDGREETYIREEMGKRLEKLSFRQSRRRRMRLAQGRVLPMSDVLNLLIQLQESQFDVS